MEYELNRIASLYAEKGKEMSDVIQSVLTRLELQILEKTPVEMSFIPWKTSNPVIDKNACGTISWNPIDDTVMFQYRFQVPYVNDPQTYSRILKWYVSKWNDENAALRRSIRLTFIYPGSTVTELIIQTNRVTSMNNLGKTVKETLILLYDTIAKECVTIYDILSGNPPYSIKKEVLEVITNLLKEMNQPSR